MAIKIREEEYDCLYDAMQNEYLAIPINQIWCNADEIDFFEADFCGVYTTTVTYSETDIVNYEWVYIERLELDEKLIFVVPSRFPDARIFGCLDYFNRKGITQDFISLEWSYEPFIESDYAVLDYSSPTFKEENRDSQPEAVTVTFNGQKYQMTNKITKYLRIPKKTLERYCNNWDRLVEDKFMGKIIIYGVTSHGEQYEETYTINKVEDNVIECEEYDIPLVHYEDEPTYNEEYRNGNVTLNNIEYSMKYVPYTLEEVL